VEPRKEHYFVYVSCVLRHRRAYCSVFVKKKMFIYAVITDMDGIRKHIDDRIIRCEETRTMTGKPVDETCRLYYPVGTRGSFPGGKAAGA
jgi:hypothetical protein